MTALIVVAVVLAAAGAAFAYIRWTGSQSARLDQANAALAAEEKRREEQEKAEAEASKIRVEEFNAKVDSAPTDSDAANQRLLEAITHANGG